MTTLIIAGTMARARQIAAAHEWPRSAWSYCTDPRKLERYLYTDFYLDTTAASLPHFASLASVIQWRLNPLRKSIPTPSSLAQAGRLDQPEGATA